MVLFSLTTKLTLQVIGGTVLVFALVLGYTYFSSRSIIHEQVEDAAREMTESMARRIEQEFRAIAKIPESLAIVLETQPINEQELNELLSRLVAENEEVFGSTVAFQPFAWDTQVRAYAPYYYMADSEPQFVQLGIGDYNYFGWDWYQLPLQTQRALWTEPFFDEGGGDILMCTYTMPFYHDTDEGRVVWGIVTADLSLEWMSDLIGTVRTGDTGFGFLISASGQFVAHPDHHLIMNESVFTVADQTTDPAVMMLGQEMMTLPSGLVTITSEFTDGDSFVAFSRIPSTGWSLGVVFHRDEMLADFHGYNILARQMAVVGAAILFLVVLLIARSITGPLRRIARVTRRVADGDLDFDLSDVRSHDEVGRLAQGFSQMSADLKRHIIELTETTAAKERIESELDVATEIQNSVLPRIFPPFPEQDDFDIHATMKAAKEVGGDFYDFFFVDDDRLALVIGDVSGKGVPAALFMMVSRTLINAIARRGKSPGEVLAETNDRLCEANDAVMFVTVLLAYYHVLTGEITFANAGHGPALIIGPDGSHRAVGLTGGTALGCFPGLIYREETGRLQPGELIAVYTDGISEAHSPDDVMFGDNQFRQLLEEQRHRPLDEICSHAVETLLDFQASEQFDDITLLLLRRTRAATLRLRSGQAQG